MSGYNEESHGEKSRPRHGSPLFYRLLEEMAETHDRKSHDYASDENPSGNYHFAGQMAGLFVHSFQDAGFFGRLAEKVYRLANLEKSGKHPKNETIEDTEKDICVIAALWMADRRDRRAKKLAAIEKIQTQTRAGEWSGLNKESDLKEPEFDVRDVQQVMARSQKAIRTIIELYGQLTVDDTLQVASFFAGCRRDIEHAQNQAQGKQPHR